MKNRKTSINDMMYPGDQEQWAAQKRINRELAHAIRDMRSGRDKGARQAIEPQNFSANSQDSNDINENKGII